ncbi:MAG: hypothetical protein OK454_11880, partial [Thaumarchaeota archaeon]|nr:hypothetical protein [Nitrososphaerota archaeon]
KQKKTKRSSVVQEENGDSRSETQRSEPADDWAEEANRAEALMKLEGTAGPAEDDWVDSSSSKKKKKKKNASKPSKESSPALDDDQDPASTDNRRVVSVPIDEFDGIRSEPEAGIDDEWETSEKAKKRSTGDSAAYESLSRSTAESEVGTSSSRKSKKDRRRSGQLDPDDPEQEEPPDRKDKKREPYRPDDRDVDSVVSVPARYDEDRYDEKPRRSKSRGSRMDDDDDAKSIASAPASSDRKRSSRDDKRGSKSDKDKRNSSGGGFFSDLFGRTNSKDSSRSEKEGSKSGDKKTDSFLDNAGISGEDAGLAGVVTWVASSMSRSNAVGAPSERDQASTSKVTELS